ncbi:GGDEF domain-containing response regulator [Thauera linaloolentis]|uniref:Response regulator receiver modulated diguanylate cyclase n=1 Tax=Thauera linaloolentis (strain DSM 12138 / JCM 21573 / CCUG 41526 / CIP 105981 / IAM 15112 / NBRC 102519 / 47Lol) TaxID=1123367 RepID=N6YE38_THAL4|nr:response regulator receiver modulated diguanylate cyclase [Thauera linaloolentis 47Lol = DSM 12138]
MIDDGKLPRILVVDDSRMVRASILKNIRGRFEAREEVDGEAGWEALLVDPSIGMVLTDIGMPRLDGFGLLERIRASRMARVRDLPVVIISGDEDEHARERALALGANGFIAKGVGSVELLATLNSLTRLSRTQTELERSREALARKTPKDPDTGLVSSAYLEHHGEQALAEARRRHSDIAVMVIELDAHEALLERYGAHVVQLIVRKLTKMVTGRIRTEDSVSQHSATQFALLSPGIDLASSCVFALRLCRSFEKLLLAYREERIRVTVSIGVANSAVDGRGKVSELLAIACGRTRQGGEAGGNCVIADHGRVAPDWVARQVKRMCSVDAALRQLRTGERGEVEARLPDIVGVLMPLFELIESRLHCGLPIEQLERYQYRSDTGSGDVDGTQTTI